MVRKICPALETAVWLEHQTRRLLDTWSFSFRFRTKHLALTVLILVLL